MIRLFRVFLIAACVSALPALAVADCMGPYPASITKSFSQNCAADPKLVSFCTCLMDDVQANIPLADFIELGNVPGGIENDPRFTKSTKKCSPLVPLVGGAAAAPTPSAQAPAYPGASTSSTPQIINLTPTASKPQGFSLR